MNFRNIDSQNLLLPYKLKPVGIFLILPGLILLVIRFYYELKPEFLNTKVFAFYSSYLETKHFTIIENHITEELGGLLLFIGFMFLNLSKEKEEKPEYMNFRLKALILIFHGTYLYLLFSILFVFGIAFIKIILIGIVLQSILYFLLFKYQIAANSKFDK